MQKYNINLLTINLDLIPLLLTFSWIDPSIFLLSSSMHSMIIKNLFPQFTCVDFNVVFFNCLVQESELIKKETN